MTLSPPQIRALEQLSRKRAGEDAGWTNILAAGELTVLGLAERTLQGWRITGPGEAALSRGPAAPLPDNLIAFAPRSAPRPGL